MSDSIQSSHDEAPVQVNPFQGNASFLGQRDMPAAVASAILKVMGGIERLGQTQTNTHEDYKFASVDDFYEMVRPLMTLAGLLIVANEDSVDFRTTSRTRQGDRGGSYEAKSTWLVVRYSFTLIAATQEGAVTWRTPSLRTIMVDASMGSQAFGSAESYAEKRFLRHLFKIATGDKEDVDSQPRGNLPADSESDFPGDRPMQEEPRENRQRDDRNARQGGGARMSSAAAKREGVWDKLTKSLKLQRTDEECRAWSKANSALIDNLPNNWQVALRDAYRDRINDIHEKMGGGMSGGPAEDEDAGPPPPIS